VAVGYSRRVHGVMVMIGAKRLLPGEVVHTSNRPLGVGVWPTGISDGLWRFDSAGAKTDLPVYVTDDIERHKWHKLLINLNNATIGLIGVSDQEGMSDPEVRAWMADVCEEGVRVVRAAGVAYELREIASIEQRVDDFC
jgi:ketopantoate reductase